MKQKPFLSHGIEINKAHLVQWLEIYSHCIPPFHLALRKYLPLSHVCKSVRSDFVQTWKRGKKHIFVPVNSSHTSGFTFYLLQHILFKATQGVPIQLLPYLRFATDHAPSCIFDDKWYEQGVAQSLLGPPIP